MKKYYLKLIFISTLAALISIQFLSDQQKAKVQVIDPIVLNSDTIKYLDLGLHNAAADLAWISTVQYYGNPSYKKYNKLNDYLQLVTNLDPKFTYPYAFGTLILPSQHEIDQAISLGQEGVNNNPDDWQIPYYLGTTFHIYKKDYQEAGKYFALAAATKDVPEGIRKVATAYGQTTSLRDQTQKIWEGIYLTTTDEAIKESAKNNILHYEVISLLEDSSKQYFQKNGSYPKELTELVTAGILKAIPSDPLGYTLKFGENGKIIIK
jgi:hypothetical protein